MMSVNKFKSWRNVSVVRSGASCVDTETVLPFRYVIC